MYSCQRYPRLVAATLSMLALCQATLSAPKTDITWEGGVTLEAAGVLHGGEEQGPARRALLALGGSADSAALGLGNGGQLHFSGVVIRDRGPVNPAGDLQGASNIAAPDAVRLYELWYDQNLGHGIAAQVGLLDLNSTFVVVEDASNLLNSSFGVIPSISGNVPTPIYPEPAWGASIESTQGRWTSRAGIFQGDPTQRFQSWSGGLLATAETRYQTDNGSYTFGIWRHSDAATPAGHLEGAYLLIQHSLGSPRIRGFVQLGDDVGNEAKVPRYIGAGLDVAGPLASRPLDHLVAGIASASIRDQAAETSWELAYVVRLTRRIKLQPDLQYIVHPSGHRASALLATIRVNLSFN